MGAIECRYAWVINALCERQTAQNISPEERQSLERTLNNVTEEFTALRAMYPNVAIPTGPEAPQMPYKQENPMEVFPQIPSNAYVPTPNAVQNLQKPVGPDANPQDAVAQEELAPPKKQSQFYADIQESWNRGVHNVQEYVKDPHVSIETVS